MRTRFAVQPPGGDDHDTEEAVLQAGVADAFHLTAKGGLKAQLASDRPSETAHVILPTDASTSLHIEDAATGLAVDVLLKDARKSPAQVADGYVIYAKAHVSGATLLHRPSEHGVEDFISFEQRPRAPEISYEVRLGKGVSGLRLVANTLEILDAGGAPRLRVAPPYLVGSDGARIDATLAVAGCAVDRNPAAPWGRRVTAPGAHNCLLRVNWRPEGVIYPAVLDPKWTSTGVMAFARQDHTATLLSTGNVLVVGGRNSSTSTTGITQVEVYNRTSGTWSTGNAIATGRWFHAAVTLGTTTNANTSARVLITGGINGTTTLNATGQTALLYNVSAGTWASAGNLNTPRHLHTATVLANGQVLVTGGMNNTNTLNTAARYNPVPTPNGTWAAVATNMASARQGHTATLLSSSNTNFNNKVLVAGGNSGSASVTSVQLFDPSASTWTASSSTLAPAFSPARERHTATRLANGNVLVTGGKNGSAFHNTAVVYTIPASGSTATWASAGTMQATRTAHTATLLPTAVLTSGQVLLVGGSNGTALPSAELWNGTTTWTLTAALSTAVQAHTATLLGNNMLLVAGGSNGTTATTASTLYDPSTGSTCTTNSQCASGFCVSGVCCDTACTDACKACNLTNLIGTCSPKAENAQCDDAKSCTTGDKCVSGVCTGTVSCTPPTGPNATCLAGSCNASGACAFAAANENGTCNDTKACTTGDKCVAGVCTGAVSCTPPAGPNATCLAGSCNASGACTFAAANENGTCSDTKACTTGDKCVAGVCTGGVSCTPPAGPNAACLAGSCDASGACTFAAANQNGTCSDGKSCTAADKCVSGVCTGTLSCPAPTGSNAPCLAASCDAAGVCGFASANANGTCNDGNQCTVNDTCIAGACQPGAATGCGTGTTYYPPIVEIPTIRAATDAFGINDTGEVVGIDYAAWPPTDLAQLRALRFTEGSPPAVVAPSVPSSTGYAINAAGVVVGGTGAGNPAFSETAAGVLTVYPVAQFGPSMATGVNANLQFTGFNYPPGGVSVGGAVPFRYSPGIGLQQIGMPPSPQLSGIGSGNAIDEQGQVVGYSALIAVGADATDRAHAFLYTGSGASTDLNSPEPPAGWRVLSVANAVVTTNAATTMIGGYGYRTDGSVRGFRHQVGGSTVDVGLLPAFASTSARSTIEGINKRGDVVGYVFHDQGTDPASNHAFLYTAEGQIHALKDFVAPGSTWVLQVAKAVNNRNEIVGYGTHNGVHRGFKIKMPDLSPCPAVATKCMGPGTRDLASGTCTPVPLANGTGCNDDNACTQSDTCQAGVCGGTPVAVDDANPCTSDSCNAAWGPVHTAVNENGSCDDGNSCTSNDACRVGVCQPGAIVAACTTVGATYYAPIVDLGAFGPDGTEASGINEASEVVGMGTFPGVVSGQTVPGYYTRPFRFTDAAGTVAIMTDPACSTCVMNAYAYGINNSGLIVGGFWGGGSAYSQSSGLAPVQYSFGPATAHSINNLGQFAGLQSWPANNGPPQAFRYTAGVGLNGLEPLGTLTAPIFNGSSHANGIDDTGRVVGNAPVLAPTNPLDNGHAFVFSGNGPMQDLNDLLVAGSPFSRLTFASATNGTYIVGYGFLTASSSVHAFRMNQAGVATDIGTFPQDPPGQNSSAAEAINANGDVVGRVFPTQGGAQRGFLYTASGQMVSLTDYVDPNSNWVIEVPKGINSKFEIVGYGKHNGVRRAFKMKMPDLSPCPPPDAAHGAGIRDFASGECTYPSVVIPSLDGIVDVGTTNSGPYLAVFGYTNAAATNVTIAAGESTNAVFLNSEVVNNPSPKPPTIFLQGTHRGAFASQFNVGQAVTWKVLERSVTATSGSPRLPGVLFGTSGVKVTIGGRDVIVRPDTGPPDVCVATVEVNASLSGAAQELQFQEDIVRACTGTGMSVCEQTIRARMNVDFFMSAAAIITNRMTTGTYQLVIANREEKLRRVRADETLACRVVAGDGDGDYVPDSDDSCPDTPPLTPVLANGCTNTVVPAGANVAEVQKILKYLVINIDSRCADAPRPAMPAPLGAFRSSAPSAGKAIWISRNPGATTCPVYYQIEAHLTDGGGPRSVTFQDSEDTNALDWIARPAGAVQFSIRNTDPGNRGSWASYAIYTNTFRVRAFNFGGRSSDWSDYFTFGSQDCVTGQPCQDL